MDVLDAALQSAPQIGAMAGLIWLAVLLFRREATAETRHAAELRRLTETHRAEITGLRSEVTELRSEVNGLHRQLDSERRKRRYAEHELSMLRRGEDRGEHEA